MSTVQLGQPLASSKSIQVRRNAGAALGALLVVAVALFGCWVVGSRGMDIGTDTDVYAGFFLSMDAGIPETRLEPGFVYLTYLLRQLGLGVAGYQGALFAVLLGTVVVASRHYYQYLGAQHGYLTFLCAGLLLLFISPMFVNASINLVRQGLAAPLVFASLLCFQQKRWRFFLLYAALATSLHVSSLIYLACAPALLLSNRMLRLLAGVAFLAYVSGASLIMVRAASPALYSTVMEYSASSVYAAGVRVDFAIFTIFWYALANVAAGLVKKPFRQRVVDSTAVYLVMVLPFFIIGWGYFSNRYLLPGWLAASLIFAAIVWHNRIPMVRHPLMIRLGLIASCIVFYYYVKFVVVI